MNTAIALCKPWAFTDCHADLAYASYFASLAELRKVDWNVMPLEYWADDEIKAKRQAEFLVRDSFPWSAVESIGVKCTAVEAKVQTLLHGRALPLAVRPDWYY